jgi:hypothetical protein
MSRKFLINIHIPKCGGTTFLGVLQRNFRNRYDSSYGHIWRDFYTEDQILKYIVDDPRFEVFSSHEVSLNLPFFSDKVDLDCTVSLRDPLQRTISHYFFERQRRTTKFKDTLNLTLNQWLELLLKQQDHWLFNYQTKHLIRNTTFKDAKDIVDLATKVKLHPVVLERMPESMVMLEQHLSDRFKDCSFKATNQSRHTENPDSELTAELLKRNSQDLVLEKWGNQVLDQFLSNDPEAHNARMVKFYSRCKIFAMKAGLRDGLYDIAKWARNKLLL